MLIYLCFIYFNGYGKIKICIKRQTYWGFSLFLSFFSNFTIKFQTGSRLCWMTVRSVESWRTTARRQEGVAMALGRGQKGRLRWPHNWKSKHGGSCSTWCWETWRRSSAGVKSKKTKHQEGLKTITTSMWNKLSQLQWSVACGQRARQAVHLYYNQLMKINPLTDKLLSPRPLPPTHPP